MVGQVLEANRVTFHEDELPPEGIDIGKMQGSNVRVKGFDGAQRRVMGEVKLPLQIGPEEFVIIFQVLDITVSYNLLLGRPWIHVAGAVPSSLHQTLKFIWDDQEVVVHGEDSNPMYPGHLIPVIENSEELDGSVFHTRDIMCAYQIEKSSLSRVLRMVALEMLKNGFVPGQGLGANSDGIKEPIQLCGQKHTFGIGYEPTPEEVSAASLRRKSDFPLPQPIPFLDQSFFRAVVAPETEEVAEDDLVKGLKNLFIDEATCNVILEDCTGTPTVWDAKPGDVLKNWTCSPSLAAHRPW